VVDDLVSLIGDQHAGSDHGQVLGPAAAHGQSDAFGAFEERVGDGGDGKRRDVREVADVCEQPQEQVDDQAVSRAQVQLVLRVVCPAGQKAVSAREDQAEGERDQDGGLDYALDDDDLDEGVVLTAHSAELGPEAREVLRSLAGRRSGHRVTLTSWVGRALKQL